MILWVDNKKFYTDREIKGAKIARLTQGNIGWPSDKFYRHIIKENLINNAEITIEDVHRAEHIFGPAKPLLQGAMVRSRPQANKIQKITLPIAIA